MSSPRSSQSRERTGRSDGTRTAAIVLAAGGGRRLGGRPKPLVGRGTARGSAVEQVLRGALATGAQPLLVLGHQADRVEDTLRRDAAELMTEVAVLRNPQWSAGLSSSLRTGVRAAADRGAERCAVLLADQPGIGEAAVSRVLGAHRSGRITRGTLEGRPTHPVVLDLGEALRAAESASGDEGARRHLRTETSRVDPVDLTGLADDADLDTPEDVRQYLENLREQRGSRDLRDQQNPEIHSHARGLGTAERRVTEAFIRP